jgi:hypothetical protein
LVFCKAASKEAAFFIGVKLMRQTTKAILAHTLFSDEIIFDANESRACQSILIFQ